MLVRFLAAIALATTTAAFLAGTDTAAQAPPVQQPAAAAAAQPPKPPKEWPRVRSWMGMGVPAVPPCTIVSVAG